MFITLFSLSLGLVFITLEFAQNGEKNPEKDVAVDVMSDSFISSVLFNRK